MSANRTLRSRIVVTSLFFLCAPAAPEAASARAGGIDYQIKYVPDFDQKRGVGPGIPGLPNNGACHCMPTSSISWVAFLANRGYPQLGPPGNWQLPERYNIVTAALDNLGDDMFTSPGGPDPKNPGEELGCGTGGDEAQAALQDSFDALTPGKFCVTQYYADGAYCPRYTDLVNAMLSGGLVLLRYGHYDEFVVPVQGAPAYVRDGGHIMSLTGVTGYYQPGARVRVRNPSSDESPDDLVAQSLFKTNDSGVDNVAAMFIDDDDNLNERTQTRLTDISTNPNKFIDGYIQIKPKFGLVVPDCCNDLQMNSLNPIPALHGSPPMNVNYTSPSGTAILDVEIHPELGRYFMMTAAVGVVPSKLWSIDALSGASTLIMNLGAATSMTTGRRGEVYVLEGAMLRVIDPDAVPAQIGAVSIPGAPIAGRMDYDDVSDEVVGISSSSHELVRIKWSPAGPTIVRKALPAGAAMPGLPIACCKGKFAGRVWMTSSQAISVYAVEQDVAGALQVVDQINLVPVLAGVIATGAMHVDTREHVLLARQVGIVEYMKVGGIWVEDEDSDFAGLPSGKHLRIASSRNNFNPLTMTGPSQMDVLPTDEGPSEADCLADIAPAPLGNGVVDIDDLLLLINGWGPCAGTPENCPADIAPGNVGNAVVDIDDLLMVINAWGPC